MTRNLDGRRSDVSIYDQEKKWIDRQFWYWLEGNVKARYHSYKLDNKYRVRTTILFFRAQLETYKYYQSKVEFESKQRSFYNYFTLTKVLVLILILELINDHLISKIQNE
jgi:hypothetical protein